VQLHERYFSVLGVRVQIRAPGIHRFFTRHSHEARDQVDQVDDLLRPIIAAAAERIGALARDQAEDLLRRLVAAIAAAVAERIGYPALAPTDPAQPTDAMIPHEEEKPREIVREVNVLGFSFQFRRGYLHPWIRWVLNIPESLRAARRKRRQQME